jgi:Fic family protein
MKGLVSDNGKYRKKSVGIMAGDRIAHMAPPAENVPHLMNDLFKYLKTSDEISLIKSCVFHYEMEFIHPFIDGNGRMGRLWQTLILMKEYPVFEFIPFENSIHKNQKNYYHALSQSDKSGSSTPFIEYMLRVIDDSLYNLLDFKSRILTTEDRLSYFSELNKTEFSRKDYMNVFKEISSATASRDLKKGVDLGLFHKEGDKTKTVYRFTRF